MDVQPAHLNRDSFRESFEGLVALEIMIDLPIGFPINNIISLSVGEGTIILQASGEVLVAPAKESCALEKQARVHNGTW